TSRPCSTHRLYISSTSSTQIDIHAPLSAASLSSGPNVSVRSLRPRLPCAPSHRKTSNGPAQTPPKLGGSPHAQAFSHPSFSNHAKLSSMLETFRIGVIRFGFMATVTGSTVEPLEPHHYFFFTNFINIPLTESAM